MKKIILITGFGLSVLILLVSCEMNKKVENKAQAGKVQVEEIVIKATANTNKETQYILKDIEGTKVLSANGEGFIALDVDIPVAGRYKTEIRAQSMNGEALNCWVEDYSDNTDDRTYNISGILEFQKGNKDFQIIGVDGSPLNKGLHKMKIHFNASVTIDYLKFTLIKPHDVTPQSMTQKMDGSEWSVVWSDEFESKGIDTEKWTYDAGNWGWGNFEPQYYTHARKENARIEDGKLIIEARKNDMGQEWTSARLTTRGKTSFLYGKIEFKAIVPKNKGNWAAGWTLGDDYVDEKSWPYCGEIDILESVGFEMDDETGKGIAHASVHCRAYYFKIGNQVTAKIPLEKMDSEFHTYAVEWTPESIYMLVDNERYFTYERSDEEHAWPFDKPQNIILNLAMGGGWGGAQGMDETITTQKMIIEYVRVYEKK